jgi:tetratricopeptide (TPR) repeat protein
VAQQSALFIKNYTDSLQRLINDSKEDTFKVYKLISLSYFLLQNHNPTKTFGLAALSLATKLHFNQGIGTAYENFASSCQQLKDFKDSQIYFQKVIELAEAGLYRTDNQAAILRYCRF